MMQKNQMEKTQSEVQRGATRLAVYQWNNAASKAKTIVLLHGYPDSAHAWDAVAAQLALDFHVVSYDMRGTGQSSTPNQRADYAFAELVADLSAVIDAVSPNRSVHLVGHDWGALQGWEAVFDPQMQAKIASFTTLAPSLDHVGWWFKQQLQAKTLASYRAFIKQVVGSGYMGMFQVPFIPELTWKLGLHRYWWLAVSKLENQVIAPSPTQRKDGVNGLALYRQNLIAPLTRPQVRQTSIPVHAIIMRNDPFVPAHLFEGMQQQAPNLHYSHLQAGHWGILSQPQQLAQTIAAKIS